MSYLEINNLEKFMLPWNETKFPKIIDDVDMKKGCIKLVKEFNREGLDLDFAEKGLEGRCEIALDFYESVKKEMGITAELQFCSMPENVCGG